MNDSTIGQPPSNFPLSQEDDVSMVGIDSGEPLPNPQVDKAVKPKEQLDTMSDLSDLEEETEAEHLVTVKDPLSKSKGSQSDLLDMSKEGDNEAVRSTNAIDSSDSSEKRKIACPLVWIVELMQPVEESNQISSDFESAVKLSAQMELRRSARNIAHNFPAKTINYADYVP